MKTRDSRLSYVIDAPVPVLKSPEKKLLVAMLERSIVDFIGVGCSRTEMLDAIVWILSPENLPFSFIWVCEELELPFVKIRNKLCEAAKIPSSLTEEELLQKKRSFKVTQRRRGMTYLKIN